MIYEIACFYDDPKGIVDWLSSYDYQRGDPGWSVWERSRKEFKAFIMVKTR